MEYNDRDKFSVELLKRIREKSKPIGFSGAANEALPAALLAAALGGVGSFAMSKGNPTCTALGAAGSGLGTLLLNGFSNSGYRNMSIEQAYSAAVDELLEEEKEEYKKKYGKCPY